MRRSVLITLVVLGSLISLIGGTGLFAALVDTASTGVNSVDSAGLPPSADIQLAAATDFDFPVPCGTFEDDLEIPFVVHDDLQPGQQTITKMFCIKNVGSQPVTISATVESLTDVEVGCTGDEALYDETTCGDGAEGELSSVLQTIYITIGCEAGGGSGFTFILSANFNVPHPLNGPELAPGEIGCYQLAVDYPSTTPADAVQAAQSDLVTWVYTFIGDAS